MVLSENAVYRYTSNTSNIPPLPNENSHPPTTLIGQSPQVTIWIGQMTIAHQNGHFNREKNDGSTMDQPWIKDGSKWWTKNFKHVDVLCWYRIRTNIMMNHIGEYAYVFSRQVICPWLLHLHDWLDTLCCISFTVGSIISYHHSYHFGWPTLHDINPGSC